MKVGILGTGFGSYHASLYKRVDEVEAVKLFGRNEEKLERIKGKLQIEVTKDIHDIINDPDIGLVDICLPTSQHAKYIIEALKAGKNVFCETPLCYSLEEVEAIGEAELEYGRRVFVDLFIKFTPEYRYIYDAIQNNTYGTLKSLRVIRNTPPLWGDLGPLAITPNLMIHDLDFAVWLLGTPRDISVSGISGRPGESKVNATLKYDGAVVEVSASSMMPKSYPFTVGYEVIFEKGMVEYREHCTAKGSEKSIIEYTPEGKRELNLGDPEPYELSIRHVLECCREGKDTIIGVQDAMKSLEIAFRLRDMLSKEFGL